VTVKRLDNVAVVVDDLDAAMEFFAELGLELEGRMQIEGDFADQSVGIDGIRSEIAMMRTPDGHGRLELTKYHRPAPVSTEPSLLRPNTLGLHRVMFAVDDIEGTVNRLRSHGAQLMGSIARYEDTYLLCYIRGPEGIVIGPAEELQ